jgi:DNA-binding SARP family transcriptional activator
MDVEVPLTGKPRSTASRHVIAGASQPVVRLRCLGPFSLTVGGHLVDEASAKPREQALLHLLVTRPGSPIHREELVEALWPECDPDAGRHRLHVAVSALRRLLGPHPTGEPNFLARKGESYRLALPTDSDVDLWTLDSQLIRAETARNAGQPGAEEDALQAALDAYGGPLLAGDGPEEWVVHQRRVVDAAVVSAAVRLGQLRFECGRYEVAIEAARVGLSVDHYRDDLWHLLIESAERAGRVAEATSARHSYEDVLVELGV